MPADFDVLTSRKDRNGKWQNTRIGAAFHNVANGSINIILDALPLTSDDGVARITLFKHKPRPDGQQGQRNSYAERSGGSDRQADDGFNQDSGFDDEVPF